MLRVQCKLDIDVDVLSKRVAAGETAQTKVLEQVRQELVRVRAQLKAAAKVPAPAAPVAPPSAVAHPKASAPVGAAVMPRLAGSRVIQLPGRYVAATWQMAGLGASVQIRGLNNAARAHGAPGQSVRAVLIKNGMPLAIAMPGAPGRPNFEQVYADLDGDGQRDQRPYFVVNPKLVDTLYVGWDRGDNGVQIVYLVQSRQVVVPRPGMAPLPVWSPYRHVNYPHNGGLASWVCADSGQVL